jgi:phage-related protein
MSSGAILGRAVLELTTDNAGLDAGLQDASTSAERVGSKMKDVGGKLSLFATAPLAAFGLAATDAASDSAEAMSKVNVVFGDSASAIHDFTKNSAADLGISTAAAEGAAGTFGNLFTAMGMGEQPAADMSKQILTLSSDLASFNNASPEEVLEKMRAGLLGEAEPLKALGINMDAAAVTAKAMEMGLADANGELSESALVQARMAIIMEQTTAAQGDFARTSDGVANQQRIAKAEMANLSAELGSVLIPLMSTAIGILRQVVGAFSELSPGMQKVIVIFGVLLAAAGPVLGFFGQVITIAPKVAGAIKTVGLAIQSAMGPWAIVLGVAVALIAAFAAAYATNFLGIRDITDQVIGYILPYIETALAAISAAFVTVSGAILAAWDAIWPVIQTVVETVWPIIATVVTTYIKLIVLEIETALAVIQAVWGVVFPILQTIVETVFPIIADVVMTYISVVQTVIETALSVIQAVWDTVWPALQTTIETVASGIETAAEFAGRVRDTISGVLSEIQEVWDRIWGELQGVVEEVGGKIEDAADFIENVYDTITDVLGDIKSEWDRFWNGLADTAEGIAEGVASAARSVMNGVIGAINGMLSALGSLEINIPGIDIPLTDKDFPGVSIGFPDLSIPYLAAGGLVVGPTLAMIGEGVEPEAILPLSELDKRIGGRDDGRRGPAAPVVVNVGNERLARISFDELGRAVNRRLS